MDSMDSEFETPHRIILHGEGLTNIPETEYRALLDLLAQRNISYTEEWTTPEMDVPIFKYHFEEVVGDLSDAPMRFAGKVWAALTGNGRILKVVANARNDRFETGRDLAIYERLQEWQIGLCHDEFSISRRGLIKARSDQRFSEQGRPFAEKSYQLVDRVIRSTIPDQT